MWHHLKFPKQPSTIQYLLLFPLLGFLDLKHDIKYYTIEEFTTSWALYLFLTTFWFFVVSVIIYLLCANPIGLLLPLALILGIVFLLIGVPRILYKFFNRKTRK